MSKRRQSIVVLGAGFAGLRVARKLAKVLPIHGPSITLVDKQNIHIYTPDLYEVAAAFSKDITDACMTRLRDTIATPLTRLVDTRRINLTQDAVSKISPRENTVALANSGTLHYDILVVALGSTTNYFDIPGLQIYGMPLKTVQNAVDINCHIDECVRNLWKEKKHREVYIVIAGGGATGVETASELVGSMNKLAKKYKYPRRKLIIQLIEGGDRLAGFDRHDTKIILKRFVDQDIEIYLNHRVTEVKENLLFLKTDRGEEKKMPYDVLIWAGGVKENPVVAEAFDTKATHGTIPVDKYLVSRQYDNVFAAGDCAYFEDPDRPGERLPMLAQIAFDQGAILAKNVVRKVKKEPFEKYRPLQEVYIIPVGNKQAIAKAGRFYILNRAMWYLRRLVALRYALHILPFFAAVRKWMHGNEVFEKND